MMPMLRALFDRWDGRTPSRTWRLPKVGLHSWGTAWQGGAAHYSENFAQGRFPCSHSAHFIVSLAATRDLVAAESVAELAVKDVGQCA